MSERNRRRVLLVEDEAMSRTLLDGVLVAAGFEVAPCASAAEAMAALAEFDPDAIITDIDLGAGGSGLELIIALERVAPYLAVVILSNYSITPDHRHSALGRATYLRKQDLHETRTLIDALESALSDQQPRNVSTPAHSRTADLTPVQAEVLRMVAEGRSNEEIARRRGTSLKSVEHIMSRLFDALGLVADPSLNLRVAAARIYLKEAGAHAADNTPLP